MIDSHVPVEYESTQVAADLKVFHSACVSYFADVKGALDAAEEALRFDASFQEAHLDSARAVFKMENPASSGIGGAGDEIKTISANGHVAKYMKQLEDDNVNIATMPFHPTVRVCLKEGKTYGIRLFINYHYSD